jgi:hypothetical protein
MLLVGVKLALNDPFHFLRIPADEHNSMRDWMNLRAALQSSNMRNGAVSRFVQRSYKSADTDTQTSVRCLCQPDGWPSKPRRNFNARATPQMTPCCCPITREPNVYYGFDVHA